MRASRTYLQLVALVLAALAGAALMTFATARHHDARTTGVGAGAQTMAQAANRRFTPDGRTFSSCKPTMMPCMEQAWGNLAYRQGAQPVLAQLQDASDHARVTPTACHQYAHTIGQAVVARLHGDVASALAEGTSLCSSGYYHGAVIGAFAGRSATAVARQAGTLCGTGSEAAGTFKRNACAHGVGHGVMVYSNYELNPALQLCDSMPATQQPYCQAGAYMEIFSPMSRPLPVSVTQRYLRDGDPFYACGLVGQAHREQCYLEGVAVMRNHRYTWPQTMQQCARLAAPWAHTCYMGAGRFVGSEHATVPAQVVPTCRLAGSEQRECILQAVNLVTTIGWDMHRSSTVCDAAPAAVQLDCYRAVGGVMQAGIPDRWAAQCRLAAPRWRAVCLLQV